MNPKCLPVAGLRAGPSTPRKSMGDKEDEQTAWLSGLSLGWIIDSLNRFYWMSTLCHALPVLGAGESGLYLVHSRHSINTYWMNQIFMLKKLNLLIMMIVTYSEELPGDWIWNPSPETWRAKIMFGVGWQWTDLGSWAPVSQPGGFPLKCFLSFEPDSFMSGNVCITEIEPSETKRPPLTQIIKSSKASFVYMQCSCCRVQGTPRWIRVWVPRAVLTEPSVVMETFCVIQPKW